MQRVQIFEMKFSKLIFTKIFLFLISNQIFFNAPTVNSAEEIKIIYSVFTRTIKVDSLKNFTEKGHATKKLRGILNATGTSDDEIKAMLTKNFEIPITIASKLVYSEIGNVVLIRLSAMIHPPRANDEETGMLALRASIIKGLDLGEGKINLIGFFEGYPTKTVILNVNALNKVMNKVESISDLLEFFTNSPLEKIKTN